MWRYGRGCVRLTLRVQKVEELTVTPAQIYPPSSRSKASVSNLSYRFYDTQPLEHFPNPGLARSVLTKLANDEAVLHVMNAHRFSVELLTELVPRRGFRVVESERQATPLVGLPIIPFQSL